MSSTAGYLIQKHPLQRLASPTRGFSALIHLLGLLSFTGSFRYLIQYPSLVNDSYGWHFQYLTNIGLALAALTFVCGFFADITLSPRFFVVKNVLAMTSAPLEVLITLLYWSLRAIDKKLVIPEWAVIDPIADVGFHLMPTFFLLLDLLLLSPPWTITVLPAIGVSTVLAFGYWAWIELCYQRNGWYPYPIFEVLNTPYRAALFAVSALLMTASTTTLKWFYRRLNDLDDGRVRHARPGAVKAE